MNWLPDFVTQYHVDFDSPWYLLLLGIVPVMWWFSFRGLSGLGPVRRIMAMSLRTAVLVLFIFAIAGIQLEKSTDRLTVIFLLDQSKSIPKEHRDAMVEYFNTVSTEHRDRDDRVGVIVFGRDAAIEIPPFDDDVQMAPEIESQLDPEYTNLSAAIKLAQASFPADTAKRIVIISDGNQNMGDAVEQARAAAEAGVGIDVQPIYYGNRAEVSVEKVAMPSDVRKGQPFDLRVVVNNSTAPTESDPGQVSGRLVISQQTDDQPVVLSDQRITLGPGKKVYSIRQQIDEPAFYTFDARFIPDNPADDGMPENNRSSAYTHIRGSGQVLLIEDHESPGEHAFLAARLQKENLEVTVRPSDQLFTGLQELQQYDTVILANVPRENFSDEQIQMLAHNTEHLGAGLVMLGGQNSFGAGGWVNTPVEEALPLDFQIKSAKVVPKGALALLMHASEMADGNFWQKKIAEEAIKTLGPQDECALLDGNGERWLWGGARGFLAVGRHRDQMLAQLDRMAPADIPEFDPGMQLAARSFNALAASADPPAIMHMIIISDGDPAEPSRRTMNMFINRKPSETPVTITTVAVAAHGPAESSRLQRIARQTGGKYYAVNSGKALPRIYQKEARRVSRPLIYEDERGFQPQRKYIHEITAGIDGGLPPITGYVMTSVKKNPLVEVAMVSPVPAGEENTTLLATWTYGLGKGVCFTSDAGARWATDWTGWENYDKFFSQMIRWSMRPVGDQGKFTLATEAADGKVRVFVTALDKDDEFLNFLEMGSTVIGPDMKPRDIRMEQTAPGRYVGEFDGTDAGSYFLMLNPGTGLAPIRAGVNVPYSAEFRERETNAALMESLAALKPKGEGAKPGVVIEDPTGAGSIAELMKTNTFRRDLPKAVSSQDVWHYLIVLSSCIFFFDVLVRRVTISFAWVAPIAAGVKNFVMRREREPEKVEYMDRLRSRKAEVSETLERRRAAARFEPQPDAPVDTSALDETTTGATKAKPPVRATPAQTLSPAEREEESYTSRLLKAKKQVWQDREKKGEK